MLKCHFSEGDVAKCQRGFLVGSTSFPVYEQSKSAVNSKNGHEVITFPHLFKREVAVLFTLLFQFPEVHV
jgi:hypothetical protein